MNTNTYTSKKKKYQSPEIVCLTPQSDGVMYYTSVPVGGGEPPLTPEARSNSFIFWEEEVENYIENWGKVEMEAQDLPKQKSQWD